MKNILSKLSYLAVSIKIQKHIQDHLNFFYTDHKNLNAVLNDVKEQWFNVLMNQRNHILKSFLCENIWVNVSKAWQFICVTYFDVA